MTRARPGRRRRNLLSSGGRQNRRRRLLGLDHAGAVLPGLLQTNQTEKIKIEHAITSREGIKLHSSTHINPLHWSRIRDESKNHRFNTMRWIYES